MPHESPLYNVHSHGSDEGSLSLNELTDLCISLSNNVKSLETKLKETKKTYNSTLTQLIRRVKKLEHIVKASKSRRRGRVVESDDEEDLEDPSKQGRSLIKELGMDAGISLVPPHAIDEGMNNDTQIYDLPTDQLGVFSAAKLLQMQLKEEEVLKLIKLTPEEEENMLVLAVVELVLPVEQLVLLIYHAHLNRPYSVAEVRKNMVMYLKNKGGYKMNSFKGMKYEDIRPIFEKVWDQIQSFVPMDSKDKEKDSKKKAGERRKKTLARKRTSENQSEKSMKKQKLEDDIENEELKSYLDLVPREEFAMEIESLATKYPIVDWKTHVLTENFMYYQIIRADGSSKNYKIFIEMLDDFDRQDGDLKILFQPDEEDEVWGNQQGYNLISWRLFDSCGIHILLMDNGITIHMMIEKKYPLT
ncbi:hypothetical protein Tco_0451226 [Tanacetum coccineum]